MDDERTGAELEAVAARVRKAGHEVGGHEMLKTAPRGYAKDHPRIEWLRAKGVTVWHQWEPAAWMGTRKAIDRIAGVIRDAAPVNDWLAANVGPSDLPDERR